MSRALPLQTAEMNAGINKALEIAGNMKKKGLDNALIAEMTGLSLDEINKLVIG